MSDARKGTVDLIYGKINEMLGAGSQLFTMLFPGQPLNYRRFVYDTDDRNSVLTKPYTVAEAEFRLSNQLMDVAPITQAPTGKLLSEVYDTLINNYVPDMEKMAPFFHDRAGMTGFLLEDSGEKDEDGEPLSRMALAARLYRAYLEASNQWHEDKDETFEDFRDNEDLDGYANWLSTHGMVRQAELDNLYNAAVVRGHLHEIMTILGYLNAKSTSEELEGAKARMRHSGRLSLDESLTVYPVQFQPSNWFLAMQPNLAPQDLTMAQGVLRDQLRQKRKELSRAKSALNQLELSNVSQETINKLRAQQDEAKSAIEETERKLIGAYGSAVVTAAKIYIQATKKGDIEQQVSGATKGVVNPAVLKDLGLAEDEEDPIVGMVEEAVKSMQETYDAQQANLRASADLAEIGARVTGAQAGNLAAEKLRLQQRVDDLKDEVAYLGDLVSGAYNSQLNQKVYAEIATMTEDDLVAYAQTNYQLTLDKASMSPDQMRAAILKKAVPEPPTGGYPVLPTGREDAEVAGFFTDIVIKSQEIKQSSQTQKDQSASQTRWGVSGWFFSAGGSSSTSSASFENEEHFFEQDIEIGFRVAKVSFDRGGWFNPQLFGMSHAFFRLADLRAGADLSKEKIRDAVNNKRTLSSLVRYQANGDKGSATQERHYALPAYPTAMVIAKDITIKVKIDQEDSETSKKVAESANSISGGFLCFSASHSDYNKSSAETAFHGASHDYYYIRIPGPQIIGYFQEMVPQDNAKPYEPMFEEGKESAFAKALAYYETFRDRIGAPDAMAGDLQTLAEGLAISPASGTGNGGRVATIPALPEAT